MNVWEKSDEAMEGVKRWASRQASALRGFARKTSVLWMALLLRVVNAFSVQTYFNPDEYWQALEVAHRMAFGFGHLTWEWHEHIRGYTHPLLFAVLYHVLRITGLDYPSLVVSNRNKHLP